MNNNTNEKLIHSLKVQNEVLLRSQPGYAQVSIRTLFEVFLEDCEDYKQELHKFNCLSYLNGFNYKEASYSKKEEQSYKKAFFRILSVLRKFNRDGSCYPFPKSNTGDSDLFREVRRTLLDKANDLPINLSVPVKDMVGPVNFSDAFKSGVEFATKYAGIHRKELVAVHG